MKELLLSGDGAHRFFLLMTVVAARLGPIFAIAPFLGGRRLQGAVRNSLALGLAALLMPWMMATAPGESMTFMTLLPVLAKEAMLGLIIGFLSSLAFHAAAGVGVLTDNQRGLPMAQTDDPLTGETTTLMGSLIMETLVMVFVAAGGLVLFFQALLASYAFWPPFSFWPDFTAEAFRNVVLGNFSWFMTAVFVLAFPMLLVCFLVDLGMGLMNRFAPQLNVFFLVMPVKSGLSLAVMLVYWGVLFRTLGKDALRMTLLWEDLRRALVSL